MKEEKQDNIKMGFFKKVGYSITKIEKYPEMATQGIRKAISYLLKIVAILAIVLCLGTVYQIHIQVRKGIDYLQNEFPDLEYKDGNLQVKNEGEIIIPAENTIFGKVIIDTRELEESQINQYINTITEEGSGIIVLKDNLIVKNTSMTGTIAYKYNEVFNSLGVTEFSKQDIINYANSATIFSLYFSIFLILFIYAFVMYLISTVLDVVIISIFGHIATLLAKIRMRYVAIFNMSVYALTLSILLETLYVGINAFVPFTITYFRVMYVSVAAIYLIAAILILKTDIREQQIELMKIKEEEKNVKKELEDEKNKNEQEKEERRKKDKENENKENEDKDVPDTPEGSNA